MWHDAEGRFPFTVALGMPAIVAERTGVTVVSDFRARDLAVGGKGMPLSAMSDFLLFRQSDEDRVLVHLGGQIWITHLPAEARVHDVLGFEAGPCNLLLDGLMRRLNSAREEMDVGGKYGVQGHCLEPLLERWLNHPYIQRRPPKSMPRPGFTNEFIYQAVQTARQTDCSLHDLLCTATQFVALTISHSICRFLPQASCPRRVLLSGGSTRNGLLWHLLEQHLLGITLDKTDRLGVAADARKALGYAILAALTVDGVPANVPQATGAVGARLLGSLTPGSSVNWARCLAWMAARTAPLATDLD
jgi:anhydro-N-acetylmuramic acid kinase